VKPAVEEIIKRRNGKDLIQKQKKNFVRIRGKGRTVKKKKKEVTAGGTKRDRIASAGAGKRKENNQMYEKRSMASLKAGGLKPPEKRSKISNT